MDTITDLNKLSVKHLLNDLKRVVLPCDIVTEHWTDCEKVRIMSFVFNECGLADKFKAFQDTWHNLRRTTISGYVLNTDESRMYLNGLWDFFVYTYDLRIG